jgi:hypothetical protein
MTIHSHALRDRHAEAGVVQVLAGGVDVTERKFTVHSGKVQINTALALPRLFLFEL